MRRRKHEPIFDTIIELRPGGTDEWVIYHDVAAVVDAILAKKPYHYERRYRDGHGRIYTTRREKLYRGEFGEL